MVKIMMPGDPDYPDALPPVAGDVDPLKLDSELVAMEQCVKIIRGLAPSAQARALRYLNDRFGGIVDYERG
jgi:hypothetical protein